MTQRPVPEGRDSRPHHISSIVHHFFDQESGSGAEVRHRRRELAVCSCGPGPLGAWVCAGMARCLATESLLLGESPWLTWSATSYLAPGLLHPLDLEDRSPGQRERGQRFWQVSAPAPRDPSLPKRGLDPLGPARVMLRHLGPLTPRQLDALETVHLGSQATPAALPGGDALIWCLDQEEAVSLSAAHTLGRVLALLRPGHLEVVVVDTDLVPPGRDGSRTADRFDPLDRCRQLVGAAGGGQPTHFSRMRATSRDGAEPPARTFSLLARRVLADDDCD